MVSQSVRLVINLNHNINIMLKYHISHIIKLINIFFLGCIIIPFRFEFSNFLFFVLAVMECLVCCLLSVHMVNK